MQLTNADASFIGEDEYDHLGISVSCTGDVNGDGFDDIIIGANKDEEGGFQAGQTYVLIGGTFLEPLEVHSFEAYSDLYVHSERTFDIGETIYFELIGKDANVTHCDAVVINISCQNRSLDFVRISLKETGINTGVYQGAFTISSSSDYLDKIIFKTNVDPSFLIEIIVHTPVQIRPFFDNASAYEDIEYRQQYWNFGWVKNPTWTLISDKEWLKFNQESKELYGNPNNADLGLTNVELNLTDIEGHFSSHKFRIFVYNSDPTLIGSDINEINQGEYYHNDYDCDDDGQGDITYYVSTNAEWLEMESNTGELFGYPDNDDVGMHTVTISVTDGNDGWDSRTFNLTVNNVNDAPIILTNDIFSINQDDPFVRHYQAVDIDIEDQLRWKLHTDADFLIMDEEMGTLSGTPSRFDVGIFFVNISVWDKSNGFDFHNFTLTVISINDAPIWTDFPENAEIIHGQTYLFDVNADDYDGDMLGYSLSSTPASDIVIDEFTGLINWTADIHLFEKVPYRLNVKVSVFDEIAYTNRSFTITVLPTDPPTVDIFGPVNGERSSSSATLLEWGGSDPENEPITYDIYLHQTEAFVQGLREEALYESDFEFDNITLSSLEQGSTYFWTVIPNDGCSFGDCVSGVQSFKVNFKPTFKNIEDHEVPAGTDFKFKISCMDEDTEDLPDLRYSLLEAPDGMTISKETGMIRWTPKDDQVMLHAVTVGISDGIEMNTASFEINVIEGESFTSTLLISIVLAVLVILLLALGIFFVIRKKKQMDEEALRKGEEERAALEKEREEEYTSYEELYGIPAPEKDEEGLTTKELKDYIHEQIEDLEGSE